VATLQLGEKLCRVLHVPARLEHLPHATELIGVIVVIDLHAAEIDQFDATAARTVDRPNGVVQRAGKYRLAFDVERVGLQTSFSPGFCKANGIKDSSRDAVLVSGTKDLGLAGRAGREC